MSTWAHSLARHGDGEKHGGTGTDSRSSSTVAGHGSTPRQGIPYPIAGPTLGRLAGGWAAAVGNRPKSDLGKRKFFLL
jgi:hypothetical protein